MSRVHSDNLPAMIAEVFGDVVTHRHDNALVFTDPEPAAAYGVALMNFYGVSDDSPVREQVRQAIITSVRRWFTDNTGPRSDVKGYAVCVAHLPS